jgi:hypothetical protein
MAVTPLNVATKGYLKSPLAVAVDGYLGGLVDILPPVEWLGGVVVLPQLRGVAMVANRFGAISSMIVSAVTTLLVNRGITKQGQPGVEVEDEEPRI